MYTCNRSFQVLINWYALAYRSLFLIYKEFCPVYCIHLLVSQVTYISNASLQISFGQYTVQNCNIAILGLCILYLGVN